MDLVEVFNKKIGTISVISFIALTLISALTRVPFYDEAHALIISTFDFEQIIQLAKIEGHPIIWFLILKPFSNLNFYPYQLTFINWFFSSILIIFFWKFAPFNNLIKFLITFSYPFIGYFGIVSRPYTLGVLAIFILTHFYKKALQKPIFYSILLTVSINIAIIPSIIVCIFEIFFIFDIFKTKIINKKTTLTCFSILICGIVLLCTQLLPTHIPNTLDSNSALLFLSNLAHFIYSPIFNTEIENPIRISFFIISCILFYYLPFILFKKDKKNLIFITSTYSILILFFIFFYVGDYWHYYFFFIALISVLWLSWDNIKNLKFLNILLIIFFIFTLTQYSFFSNGIAHKTDTQNYKTLLNIILKNNNYKNAKLFCADLYSPLAPGILPYLKKENIILYDTQGNNRMSYENFLTLQDNKQQEIKIENFIKALDKNKKNYLLAGQKFNQIHHDFSITQNNEKMYFKLVENEPKLNFAGYEIIYEK